MVKMLKYLFAVDKKPQRGLIAAEWAMMAYLVLTLFYMFFTWTKLPAPEPMLWGRVRIVITTVALWGVYRMVPCRFTMLCRVALQLALLSWWYPDTYELNRILPNLDHRFAAFEQSLFGFQPALVFSQLCSHPVFSELMYLGYASYFPLIATVVVYYFFQHYQDFQRMSFVILASFFLFYVVFIVLPVSGPQFYYLAAGLDNISQGIFPDLGDYFIIIIAHVAGERPTAAFPSSHVGLTFVLLLLAWRTRCRSLFYVVLTFFLLMCLSTVYIRAHYAIDVFAGIVFGLIFYLLLLHLPIGKNKIF